MSLLPQDFYCRDALDVARELVGAILRRGPVVLKITETEAYRWPDDTASHIRFGRTARNEPMWGPAGRVYIYLCYGIHHMLNIVTGPMDQGAAVLIRAARPLAGFALVRQRRGGRDGPDSLNGPGKVGAALALDSGFSGHPVFEPGGLEILAGGPAPALLAGPRVGVSFASTQHREAAWRFAEAASPWVGHRATLEPLER